MIAILPVDRGVYRGPQPTLIEDYHQIQGYGIKYILDLETGSALFSDGIPLQEATRLDAYGIRVYGHPLGAVLPPTIDELRMAVSFIVAHQPVYVHCRQGVDRTGMVIAAYRMAVQRWGWNMTIMELKASGFHWWYWYWLRVLEEIK